MKTTFNFVTFLKPFVSQVRFSEQKMAYSKSFKFDLLENLQIKERAQNLEISTKVVNIFLRDEPV